MSTTFTAKSEITIQVPPSKVWRALTDPALVKQWLFGTDMSVTEWKVGGKIRYKGVWEGKSYEDKGEILEFEQEKLLVSSYWSGFSGLPDAPENYQKVSYILEPMNEGIHSGTTLTIVQEGNPTKDGAKHSEDNWSMTLAELKKFLEK